MGDEMIEHIILGILIIWLLLLLFAGNKGFLNM